MLYIITPCYNPQNLESISSTIPSGAKWIICHHKKNLPKGLKASIIKSSSNNIADMLNYVLDKVAFKEDDWLLYLLDDNIIHPNLYSTISNVLSQDLSIIQWGQIFKNGTIRLPPLSYCLQGSINEASFAIKWKYNRDVRFDSTDNMFVNYAISCHNNGPLLMVSNYISYYKYLGE